MGAESCRVLLDGVGGTRAAARVMSCEFLAVFDRAEEQRTSMRIAAYGHAMDRVGDAIESTGTRAYFAGARTDG